MADQSTALPFLGGRQGYTLQSDGTYALNVKNVDGSAGGLYGSGLYADMPAASAFTNRMYFATDIGPNGMFLLSNGTTRTPTWPQVLARGGIPMIVPSSGTIGNNGALTGLTALPTTYLAAYMYFPADAIAVGVPAGLYYVVMSSTTAGTIYNNTYTSGSPQVPASPTPFATTGPGAYTQTTGADISLFTAMVPANLMGLYGGVRAQANFGNNNTGGTKTGKLFFGGTGGSVMSTFASTTNQSAADLREIMNRGLAGQQVASASTAWSGLSTGSGTPARSSIDTTAATTLVYTGQLAVATDFVMVNTVLVESLP